MFQISLMLQVATISMAADAISWHKQNWHLLMKSVVVAKGSMTKKKDVVPFAYRAILCTLLKGSSILERLLISVTREIALTSVHSRVKNSYLIIFWFFCYVCYHYHYIQCLFHGCLTHIYYASPMQQCDIDWGFTTKMLWYDTPATNVLYCCKIL